MFCNSGANNSWDLGTRFATRLFAVLIIGAATQTQNQNLCESLKVCEVILTKLTISAVVFCVIPSQDGECTRREFPIYIQNFAFDGAFSPTPADAGCNFNFFLPVWV